MLESSEKIEQQPMSAEELYHALERAAEDLFSFSIAACGGRQEEAEALIMDTLFLALERMWFTRGFASDQRFTHLEYREDLFKNILSLIRRRATLVHAKAIDASLLGDAMYRFYELPFPSRVALFLRTKCKFAEDSIARIMELSEPEVEKEIQKSREFLLGKNICMKNFEEEF